MNLSVPEIAPEHLVKLAAMECFASCALTYARALGRNRPGIMPDYWNLNYQFRTLLSSKDARQLSLLFHYGVRITLVRGQQERLQADLLSGGCAILLCSASKLRYFPASMLGLETSGFQHCILVQSWNPRTAAYRVADPMVDYIGEADREELAEAGTRSDHRRQMIYFLLEALPEYEPPSAEAVFGYCTERNWLHFNAAQAIPDRAIPDRAPAESAQDRQQLWSEWFGNRNSGARAFELVRRDVEASPDWPGPALRRWIERNQLTVTSIWKVRQQVWNSLRELQVMTGEQLSEGGVRVKAVVRLWQHLNYQLSKYKESLHPSREQAQELIRTLTRLETEERYILSELNEWGKPFRPVQALEQTSR
ncbi:hypothetical protein [Cohnella cellulosilytica]|uniref:Butirosin biosynthesis protein H-like n=1 Tax=Cohnella cellulosilytica TaxID=986710 RepID=A0ABW2FBU4_9BACL